MRYEVQVDSATGHYGYNLANWLANKGKEVVMANPATTKRNKGNRDNSPSKSDPKDALVIEAKQDLKRLLDEFERIVNVLSIIINTHLHGIDGSSKFSSIFYFFCRFYSPDSPIDSSIPKIIPGPSFSPD